MFNLAGSGMLPLVRSRGARRLAWLSAGLGLGMAAIPGQVLEAYELAPSPESYLLAIVPIEGTRDVHVLAAGTCKGEARFDPADPSRSQVAITVPARDLQADPTVWRTRSGHPTRVRTWLRERLRDDLLAPDRLHAARHPDLRFFSSAIRSVAGGLEVKGTLELRGAPRPVTVTAEFGQLPSGSLHASGSFEIRPSAFEIRAYEDPLGLRRTADRAEIRFDLIFEPLRLGRPPA